MLRRGFSPSRILASSALAAVITFYPIMEDVSLFVLYYDNNISLRRLANEKPHSDTKQHQA